MVDDATDHVAVRITGHAENVPLYATSHAAGADLRAHLKDSAVLEPGGRLLVGTGIRVEIPPGYEGQVRPRSGLAIHTGVTVLNAPGTVDSDYRGEIRVPLVNLGAEPVTIERGMRIAQLVIAPVVQARFIPVPELSESDRGSGGFGSTGTG
jgi:dUTP pyrophosphatase